MEKNISEMTIMDLSDDCLGEICKFLNESDQVNFGLSSQRFGDVFKVHCKNGRSHYAVKYYEDSEKYLKLAGSLIKSIEMHSDAKINKIVAKYCANIEDIVCLRGSLDETFSNFVKNFKMLRCVNFDQCDFDDEFILTITVIPIEELIINRNYNITGKYLSGFECLKVLSLEECNKIKSEHLLEISMKELRTLALKDCHTSEEFVQKLTKDCTKLNKLAFTCSFDNVNQHIYDALLTKLSDLTTLDVNEGSRTFSKALAEHTSEKLNDLALDFYYVLNQGYYDILTKYPNLEKLSITRYPFYTNDFVPLKHLKNIYLKRCQVSTEGLIDILQKCPKLTYINIEYNQMIIGKMFLLEVIKMLENHEEHIRPVKLHLKISGLTNDYLQTPEYDAHKHLCELELRDYDDDPDDCYEDTYNSYDASYDTDTGWFY